MVDQNSEPTLADYYFNHRGKVTDEWSLYISVYDELFSPYRAKSLRLLEIGIQNGGSLAIWVEYFKSAITIVGCDINQACGDLRYDDSRIHVVVGDANSDEVEGRIDGLSPLFDLIIDDGSHRSGDIYPVQVRTRKSVGEMIRKLSVT